MSAPFLGLACAVLSALGVLFLGLTDPKSRSGKRSDGPRKIPRLLALALMLSPGLCLAIAGSGVAFLIWTGALVLLGWGVSQVTSRR